MLRAEQELAVAALLLGRERPGLRAVPVPERGRGRLGVGEVVDAVLWGVAHGGLQVEESGVVVVAPALGLEVGGEPAEAGLNRVRGDPVLSALP
uniref:hypothetical protein n=1 Tax=Streptomyces sp. NBC_01553 TaxID=2975877 RepID=UPI002F908D75